MIVRIHDEEHTFPACHRGGEGVAMVVWDAASRDEDGHILMMVNPAGSVAGKWGAAAVYMSHAEARELARELLVAVGEVEPYYGA